MFNAIFRFITVLYSYIAKFKTKKSFVFKSIIKTNGSEVSFYNSRVMASTINIHTSGNTFLCQGNIISSNIDIWGSGNIIMVEKNVELNGTRIVLRGNNCTVKIGSNTHFCNSTLVCMGSKNELTFGEGCMIADGAEFWNTDTHPILDFNNNVINVSKPIHLGNKVWIGKNSKVLKGVTIGNNAIIGMCSIVTKNIEPNTINVGIPTKKIKSGVHWKRCYIDE